MSEKTPRTAYENKVADEQIAGLKAENKRLREALEKAWPMIHPEDHKARRIIRQALKQETKEAKAVVCPHCEMQFAVVEKGSGYCEACDDWHVLALSQVRPFGEAKEGGTR